MASPLGKKIAAAAVTGMLAGLPACGAAQAPEAVQSVEVPRELPPFASAVASADPEPPRERRATPKKAGVLTAEEEDLVRQMLGSPPDCNACKGMNECKGKGSCKTQKNQCKGMNQCKGQGGCKSDCP